MDKSNIAHRDICSSNVLVRKNLSLAIADFGFALKLTEGRLFDEEVYIHVLVFYPINFIIQKLLQLSKILFFFEFHIFVFLFSYAGYAVLHGP